MNRDATTQGLKRARFPRMRGDEPTGQTALHDVKVFSPHARG